jgi:hypothetical protein
MKACFSSLPIQTLVLDVIPMHKYACPSTQQQHSIAKQSPTHLQSEAVLPVVLYCIALDYGVGTTPSQDAVQAVAVDATILYEHTPRTT